MVNRESKKNQELFQSMINRSRINGCHVQHQIEYQGKIYRRSQGIADTLTPHFEKFLSNSEPNNFDDYFKESIEKKSKGYFFRKSVDEDGEHLNGSVTND